MSNTELYSSIAVALFGGIVSFLSPCVLPIVPGYLTLVTGLSLDELSTPNKQQRVVIAKATGAFIAGFTAVFVALSLVTVWLRDALLRNDRIIEVVSGLIVMTFAAFIAAPHFVRMPGLFREFRFDVRGSRFGLLSVVSVGMAFGFAWTPCIGPYLASILTVAAQEGSELRATILLVTYSAGVGIPFLVVGLFFGATKRPLNFLKKHSKTVSVSSAIVLLLIGLLMFLGKFYLLNSWLSQFLDDVGLESFSQLG